MNKGSFAEFYKMIKKSYFDRRRTFYSTILRSLIVRLYPQFKESVSHFKRLILLLKTSFVFHKSLFYFSIFNNKIALGFMLSGHHKSKKSNI